jgi:hypothetical protein
MSYYYGASQNMEKERRFVIEEFFQI